MNYSQNNEQEEIVKYFTSKEGTTFCDIGANDGVTLSNTRRLAELGWSGVFVEPSPKAFAKLKENYATLAAEPGRFYFYNFALGNSNAKVKMWDSGPHLNKGDHGLLSTLNEDEKKRWTGQHYDEIEVQCFRWKTFLNRLLLKEFDFISIDAEGNDLNILRQIDLRPTSAVCVEWNGKPELKEQFDALMIGFKIIYTSPENLIYAR